MKSTRQVMWLHAARDGQHHPFAGEVRRLMRALTNGHSYVCYTRPDSIDKAGEDFNATGRFSQSVFDELGLPRDADVYLCGPTRFMADMREALTTLGVAPKLRIRLATRQTLVRWYRSRVVAFPHTGMGLGMEHPRNGRGV